MFEIPTAKGTLIDVSAVSNSEDVISVLITETKYHQMGWIVECARMAVKDKKWIKALHAAVAEWEK